MNLTNKIDQDRKYRLDTLIQTYANSSPVRPLDMFNVNYSSGTTMLGLILTYMFILLQLKMGESSVQLGGKS